MASAEEEREGGGERERRERGERERGEREREGRERGGGGGGGREGRERERGRRERGGDRLLSMLPPPPSLAMVVSPMLFTSSSHVAGLIVQLLLYHS